MHLTAGLPDDERRLDPGGGAHRLGQIRGPHHREEIDERRIALAEDHRTPPHDDRAGVGGRPRHALELHRREDAGEGPAGRQVAGGDARVVADVAAHFEPALHLLRMVTLDARVPP